MEEPGRLQPMGLLRVGQRLSDFIFLFHFHTLEKEMATHSIVLAWRIPWMEKPGRLQSMGSHRVRNNWSDLAAAGLKNTRLPCPSPTPRACSNLCSSSRWCHPTISSSVVPFSSYLQSFPASGSFPMSQFFASGGQSIGVSASASNEYSGLISFRMDWLDLLAVQGTFKSLLQHHSSKASILQCSCFSIVQLSHPYMTTGKTIALTRWTFVDKVMSLLFIYLFFGAANDFY